MDLGSRESTSSILHHSSPSPGTSFPIIAIAIIGILATALLLVSYYIFVIKCCLNRHRRHDDDPLMVYAPPSAEPRGLDESVIRSIPISTFHKLVSTDNQECAVCLAEFQENEKLRVIPNCTHVFHIDCIDVWLQNNANCPLCRTSISSMAMPPPAASRRVPESSIGGDEGYVVIELGRPSDHDDPRKKEVIKKWSCKVESKGDECIDTRGSQDEEFRVQPVRRSVSMDSSADRLMFLAVREMVTASPMEGCSNSGSGIGSGSGSGRVKRSFFSFGNGSGNGNGSSRGSRSRSSSVLPLYSDTSMPQNH